MSTPPQAANLSAEDVAALAMARQAVRARGEDGGARAPLAPDDVVRTKVKAELRARMQGLRKTARGRAAGERSAAIVGTLLALPEVAAARMVALFWPLESRGEVDLRPLAHALLARGTGVALPRADMASRTLTFHCVQDASELEKSSFGVMEPRASAPLAPDVDVVVVPALLVDPRGHRLGYGAGFYDRYLATLPPDVLTVAVIYDFQLAVELPNHTWDVPVKRVVTDARVLVATA